jgi:hypothetical protein
MSLFLDHPASPWLAAGRPAVVGKDRWRRASHRWIEPVTASIAVTIASFSSVSARKWSHDGAITGAQQARCSSGAAFVNRSISVG